MTDRPPDPDMVRLAHDQLIETELDRLVDEHGRRIAAELDQIAAGFRAPARQPYPEPWFTLTCGILIGAGLGALWRWLFG